MPIAYSKVTAEGRISVPAKVRRRLGIGPGPILEWDEEDGRMVVRRAGRYTSEDFHRALCEEARSQMLEELKEGVRSKIPERRRRRDGAQKISRFRSPLASRARNQLLRLDRFAA